jgi:hypothetical protein
MFYIIIIAQVIDSTPRETVYCSRCLYILLNIECNLILSLIN